MHAASKAFKCEWLPRPQGCARGSVNLKKAASIPSSEIVSHALAVRGRQQAAKVFMVVPLCRTDSALLACRHRSCKHCGWRNANLVACHASHLCRALSSNSSGFSLLDSGNCERAEAGRIVGPFSAHQTSPPSGLCSPHSLIDCPDKGV